MKSGAFDRFVRVLALFALVTLVAFAQPALPAPARPAHIEGIEPAAARVGERVVIEGVGLVGPKVSIRIDGIEAAVVNATGHRVTFVVPVNLGAGSHVVTVTNPGFQSTSIGFNVLDGALLSGLRTSPMQSSTRDVPPAAVDAGQIDNGVIMSRLEVRFAPNATVAQVNQALQSVGGGIVSMARGFNFVTIAVPRQPSVSALQAIVRKLNQTPGVRSAFLAHAAESQVLPAMPSQFTDKHLLPTRFPAAWNAMQLAIDDPTSRNPPCTVQKVPVLVVDNFVRPVPYAGFSNEVASLPIVPADPGFESHGYDVATTLAALFNASSPTGANPFTQCLDITGVQIAGLGGRDQVDRIVQSFPGGGTRFILNYSNAYKGFCDILSINKPTLCLPVSTPDFSGADAIPTATDRANSAAYWKARSIGQWPRFLATTAAGNFKDELAASIYPGLGIAEFQSFINSATGNDPLFGFMTDPGLWSPTVNSTNPQEIQPSLTASATDAAKLQSAIRVDGLDHTGPADNVLITGSTTAGNTVLELIESASSGADPDVTAVGEQVTTLGGLENGSSFAAPQVAGLASYLWALSAELRNLRPMSVTRRAIVANARATLLAGPVIDAYATVLSLDAAVLPTPQTAPVRLAILDVNNDGKFDESDLQTFVANYFDANGDPIQPAAADYGRFDLNGDGFTGGPHAERFDLERVGSTQFGATVYSPAVTQEIEGEDVTFDATAVTDMQILCYYAYSALYTGDTKVRGELLGVGGCRGVSVKIQPTSATLTPSQTQQFTAQVKGAQDTNVTWAVDGVSGGNTTVGTISSAGLYTAPSTGGAHTVRATSVADSTAFAEASVTVQTGSSLSGELTMTFMRVDGPFPNGDSHDTRGSLTVFVRAQLVGSGSSTGLSILEARGNLEFRGNFTVAFSCFPSPGTVILSGSSIYTAPISGAVTGPPAQMPPFALSFVASGTKADIVPTCDGPVTHTAQNIPFGIDRRYILQGTPVRDAGGHIVAVDYNVQDSPDGFPRVVSGQLR